MLIDEIEAKRRQIQTDAYPMSIGEIANLYVDKELEVHPEFQRVHRWNTSQESKLIESLLLGIPLPSIFVSQRTDGVWDVIDGVQRLTTIFQFLGIFRNDKGELEPALSLEETKLLPSLKGKKWDGENEVAIDVELKRQFKREKLDIKIIKKESDPVTKFDLFQRLNTLGTKLSDQEVRNCLLIMINRDFYLKLIELSEDENFINTTPISERQLKEKYNIELVLRFLVYRWYLNGEKKQIGDVNEFITDAMELMSSDKDFDMTEQCNFFKEVFDKINLLFGENAFRKRKADGTFTGAFSLSYYEALLIKAIKEKTENGNIDSLIEFATQLPNNEVFVANSGSGVRASARIKKFCEL